MDDTLQLQLESWAGTIVSFHIPRWNELPELDLYMDQVIVFSERILFNFPGDSLSKLISPSIINNYVKLDIIPQPVKKKYSRTHIAYLLMICILKQVLPISAITDLISYQLKTSSIEEVYNHFCTVQEQATRSAVELARNKELLGKPGEEKQKLALETMVLQMAAVANSSKIFAEKVINLWREQEDEAASEQEVIEEKKSKAKK